jgi:glycosyltransferase involved in cell wall biosynthesis
MNRPPHILHVIPNLSSGGAERLLLTYLSDDAIRAGFRHTVAMTEIADIRSNDQGNFHVPAFEALGIEVVGLGRPGSRNVGGCIRDLRRLIRERGVDLVHTHLLWANIAGRIAARLSRVPAITTFHNPDYDPEAMNNTQGGQRKQGVIRRLDALTARTCLTRSIAVSDYIARHIQDRLGIRPEAIVVIHNPFDRSRIAPAHADPRAAIFAELGLKPTDRLVLNVGRASYQKALVELTDAFAEIAASHPDTHLALVGPKVEPDYTRRLRETVARHGLESRVHLIPPRSDIADFLAAADVFAFPSKFEGLGIALAEAMAAGAPCVASDIGPIPELIRHEVNGLIVPVDDRAALAGAIVRLLDDRALARRLGDQARLDIRAGFDSKDKAALMLAAYMDVLKGGFRAADVPSNESLSS